MGFYSRKILYAYFLIVAVTISEVSADCFVSSNGLVFDCTEEIEGTELNLKIEVKTCKDPAKIVVDIDVPSVFEWSETIDGSKEIPIPGLSAAGLAGVYLKVKVYNDGGDLKLKVGLSFKALVSLGSVTVIDERIGKSQCDVISMAINWWESQGIAIKIAIAGGGSLFILILICCCCCCCCCRKKQPQPFMVMVPQHPNGVISSTNTMQMVSPTANVPYDKLDNCP